MQLQKAATQKVINYKKPSVGRTLMQNRTLILMCLPAIFFFFIFSYLPMPGAYIAFTNFKYDRGIFGSDFVGLKNFEFLFISGQLGLLLKNTVLYNLAFIVLGNVAEIFRFGPSAAKVGDGGGAAPADGGGAPAPAPADGGGAAPAPAEVTG